MGRLFLSLFFILLGIGKIINFGETAGAEEAFGFFSSDAWAIITIAFELIGGALILFGFYTRVGAIILMVYLFAVTLVEHSFWAHEGAARFIQFAIFLKNVGIFGGLLLLFSYGPGSWSLDAKRCSKCA